MPVRWDPRPARDRVDDREAHRMTRLWTVTDSDFECGGLCPVADSDANVQPCQAVPLAGTGPAGPG